MDRVSDGEHAFVERTEPAPRVAAGDRQRARGEEAHRVSLGMAGIDTPASGALPSNSFE